jgi:molybdopterin converting factor small subunit
MKLNVLFFGATAATAGKRHLQLELCEPATAGAALSAVLELIPGLARHRLLYSVNEEYISEDIELNEGDEIAVFTAVSGG